VPIDVSASALSLAGDAGLTTGGGASLSLPSAHAPVRVVGLGWATVDLDRAAADLRPADRNAIAVDDELLGARGLRFAPGSGEIRLVILEPSTEGRLAASLARRGEGPLVLYVAPADHDVSTAVARLRTAGIEVRSGSTALGPGAIVLDRAAAEPQVVLVAVPSEP
jgi:hypothetical protein